jgi:undecaprenyl diphosphate synthase
MMFGLPARAEIQTEPHSEGGKGEIPRHVAIIMDGNGRWAARRGFPRLEGHRRGVEAVRRTVKASIELGIRYLTLYAFSTENWSRPVAEVTDLMGLLRRFIRNDLASLHARNVRISIIGSRIGIADDLQRLLLEAETLTQANTGLRLLIAFNYGARQEIVQAAQAMAREVAAGTLSPEAVTVERFAMHLSAPDTPDPDLLIRTSGEQRISNFLLWQIAYAELVFLPVLWPDFDREHLEEAIAAYGGRERRYGGTGQAR